MSLEARFSQVLATAMSEVQTRLATEFQSVLTDATAESERDRAAALATADEARVAAVDDARSALQAELQTAFDAEKVSLVATHEGLLAQAADAARLDASRLAESAGAELERVRQESADAQARAKADADATIDAIRSELRLAQDAAVRQRDDHEAALIRLQSEHASTSTGLQTDHDGALATLRTEHDTAIGMLRAEHDAAVSTLRGEHESAISTLRAESEAAITELRTALDAATTSRDEHAAEATRLRVSSESAVAEMRAESERTVADMRAEFEGSAARLREDFESAAAQARLLAESALATLRSEAQEAATLHSHAVDAHQTGSLRLLESVRTLDNAASLTEVLDALTIGASKEVDRAAMLVVKGERLIGWRTIGFGALDQEPRGIESSTSDVGALAAAVNTGRPAVVGSGSVLAPPAFSEAPADRPGLAVPLLVAGRPVAVLYADPGTSSAGSSWTSPVEVLVRHAARCLEGLAVQRASATKAAGARVGAPA